MEMLWRSAEEQDSSITAKPVFIKYKNLFPLMMSLGGAVLKVQ